MRLLRILGLALATPVFILSTFEATASVHLMQLKQMVAGVHGDTSAQAVAMRMRANFQNQTQGARLVAWDAAGANPVILAAPANSVANGSEGDYILYCTPAFESMTTPAAVPDFTMNPIPDSYLAAGSITFETSTGSVYWRLSWGGGGYTGSHAGVTFNDADGDFGPAFAGPAPSASTAALRFMGGATAMSVSNETDYTLTAEQPTFINNAGLSYVLDAVPTGVGPGLPAAGTVLFRSPFPNPFNPSINIPFELSRDSEIRISVHDARGNLVQLLTERLWPAGEHSLRWTGVDASGRSVAGGVYFLRLESGPLLENRKMVLVK